MNESTFSEFRQSILPKAAAMAIPLTLHLELTEECNLNCIHCSLPRAFRPVRLASTEVYRLLAEARSAGTLFVTLSGGECTLHPKFLAIARAVRRHALGLRILTNGCAVPGRLAHEIAALDPYSVEISIYGSTANLHDGITQMDGSFDLARLAIEQLVRWKVRVRVRTPVMQQNVHDVRALKALVTRLGVEHHVRAYLFPPHALPSPERRGCGAGSNFVCIAANGDMFPCPTFRQAAGNIRRATFSRIWREAPLFRQLRAVRSSQLPGCETCELAHTCVRCPAAVFMRTGGLTQGGSQACRFARAR